MKDSDEMRAVLLWLREPPNEIATTHKPESIIYRVYEDDDTHDIHLQFWGWEIVLMADGRWFWSDTSGG